MIVIKDIDHFAQKYRAFSALMGAVVLSGPILDGQGGLKLSHKPGFKFGVSVYATNNFKKEQPGLTLLVREACARGRRFHWKTLPRTKEAKEPCQSSFTARMKQSKCKAQVRSAG